jgi:GNAT superfamily N-acetyltransferase
MTVPQPDPEAGAITVWSLQMHSRADLRPARDPAREPLLMHALRPAPELSRFFYLTVGGPWSWTDRLGWDLERWQRWVDRPEHELWTAWLDGVPAGYFELEQQVQGDVELAYFGLVPGMAGHGLGGWLLTAALRRAWQRPATRRVWVHTCSLDGPAALPNYEARGLVRYAQAQLSPSGQRTRLG